MKTNRISKKVRQELGAGLVEYALLVALVAFMGVASVQALVARSRQERKG